MVLRNIWTNIRLKFRKFYGGFKFMFCETKILVIVCYFSDFSIDITVYSYLPIIGNITDVITGRGM
jgi:hypothetical protein